jgi:hypothetical protein
MCTEMPFIEMYTRDPKGQDSMIAVPKKLEKDSLFF